MLFRSVDGFDAAAENFAEIRRVIECERDARGREPSHREVRPDDRYVRQPEIEEKQLKHQRRPAHQENVTARDPAQRRDLRRRKKGRQKSERQ